MLKKSWRSIFQLLSIKKTQRILIKLKNKTYQAIWHSDLNWVEFLCTDKPKTLSDEMTYCLI